MTAAKPAAPPDAMPRAGTEEFAMHRSIPAILVASLLAACAGDRPDTIVSPRLDSGVTSSDGGGARVLDSRRGGVGVTTQVSPAR